jgi:hypothetical protein
MYFNAIILQLAHKMEYNVTKSRETFGIKSAAMDFRSRYAAGLQGFSSRFLGELPSSVVPCRNRTLFGSPERNTIPDRYVRRYIHPQ